MTKSNFIIHLYRIAELQEAETKITESIGLLDDKDFPQFSLHKPISFMIDLLKEAMNDKYDNISYFIYELNWGKDKMAKNCITEKGGTKISLQTPSQLYNYITKYNK